MVHVSSTKSPPIKAKVWVHRSLDGQDDNFDLLESYFKSMQTSTVETSNPDNFIEFAACASYFGVIMAGLSSADLGDEDSRKDLEDVSGDASQSAFPPSSQGTPPPSSVLTFGSSFDDELEPEQTLQEIYETYNALSEEEKILRWQEAFQADIEENPPTRPLSDMYLQDTEAEPVRESQERPYQPSQSQLQEAAIYFNWPDGVPEKFTDAQDMDMTDAVNTSAQIPSQESSYQPSIELLDSTNASDVEPIQFPPRIEQSPEERKWLYDAAIVKRDQLRAVTVANYEKKKRQRVKEARHLQSQGTEPPVQNTYEVPIGIVYLWTTQNIADDRLHGGEYCMGFYVAPEYRDLQNIPRALNQTIEQAFDDDMCHRVQLIIVDNKEKLYILQIVSALGFRHEGTRRLAFFSPVYNEWRDVTYFGMLATEWGYDRYASRVSVRLRTSSLFGEVLARHQQELQELIRLEEQQNRLKRTNSSETIRQTSQQSSGKRRRENEKERQFEASPTRGPTSNSSGWPSSFTSTSSSLGSEWERPSLPPSSTSSHQTRNQETPRSINSNSSSDIASSVSGSSSHDWLFVNDEKLIFSD